MNLKTGVTQRSAGVLEAKTESVGRVAARCERACEGSLHAGVTTDRFWAQADRSTATIRVAPNLDHDVPVVQRWDQARQPPLAVEADNGIILAGIRPEGGRDEDLGDRIHRLRVDRGRCLGGHEQRL